MQRISAAQVVLLLFIQDDGVGVEVAGGIESAQAALQDA